MKREVFQIGHRMFWRCNGQAIHNVHYRKWVGNNMTLHMLDGRVIPIEMVEPPEGRCPRCGEKL